jgi:hypothetical protein
MIASIDRGLEDFTLPVEPEWNLDEEALPRCFILNEKRHVILVCSPRPGDPLNARFMPKAHGNMLPSLVDHAVCILEQACERDGSESRTARLGNILLRVSQLHGPWGNHTTVVVEPAPATTAA